MVMRIRKARKDDQKAYVELVSKSNREYQRIIGKKVKFTEQEIKKNFKEFTQSKDKTILIVEDNKKMIGYLAASFLINSYTRIGNIDFLFVNNNYRKKGIAKSLIKEFIKTLKSKNINKIRLKVNIKNKKIIKIYKNLGFNFYHYEMEKKLK